MGYNGAFTGPEIDTRLENAGSIPQMQEDIATLFHAVGSPLMAATVAGMTDKTKIYVYTGSETGYTAGNWYYWDGSAWTSGGVYNATAFETDTTLSTSGAAADAKAAGDAIADAKDYVDWKSAMTTEGTENICNVRVGRWRLSSGSIIPVTGTAYIGMEDFIPCEEETTYYVYVFGTGWTTGAGNTRVYAYWFDENMQSLGSEDTNPAGANVRVKRVSPTGAKFMYAQAYTGRTGGMPLTAKMQITKGDEYLTEYVEPFVAKDDVARAQIGEIAEDVAGISSDIEAAVTAAVGALEAKTALMNYGQVTTDWLVEQGYTNLIQLPVGYTYSIAGNVIVDGKPVALQNSPFTFMAIKCVPSLINYNVYFAIGRSSAFYAIGYGGDTTPAWVSLNPEIPSFADQTLFMRWGLTSNMEVVLLGDSIVQGVGSSDYSATGAEIATIGGTTYHRNVGVKSWAAQFKTKLEAEYQRSSSIGIQVVNNGLSGQGIPTITNNLDQLVSENTNVAIVCVGVNNRTWGGTSIQTAYVDLFEALKAKNITVFALSAIDVNGATYTTSMGKMNTALERACDQCEVPYYNLYGEFNAVLAANTKADYYTDTLHPNDKGYATMYGLICKLLNF